MAEVKFDEKIKQYGVENKVPITKDDTLNFLIEKINSIDAKNILEIGTAIGFGCIAIAENTNCAHIDTVEIDEKRYNIALENIKNKSLQSKISVFNLDAKIFLETKIKNLQNTNLAERYDLVYLDGPKGQYINYLPYLLKLLSPNGVIVADNLFFHGMVTGETPITKGCRSMIKGLKNYINEITTNQNLQTEILNIGDGVGVTKIKSF